MPVFINEVTAEVPQPQVPAVQTQAIENTVSVSPSEYDLMLSLNIIEERRARLDFD